MSRSQRWKAISARIEGFVEAVRMWGSLDSALANGSQGKQLFGVAQSIFQALEVGAAAVGSPLPPGLLASGVAQRLKTVVSIPEPHSSSVQGFVGEAAVLFQSLVTEANFLLATNESIIRSLTERAFLHLQWTIAADSVARTRWVSAFHKGEVECEKLGAAHLLWHGIYPFKVHNRVATDLVLNEPIGGDQVGIAEGAVLTEWKVVRPGDNLQSTIEGAEFQADEYSSGVLGGTELRSVRYVVLVSEHKLPMPIDKPRVAYVYRHINIAVDPESPSKIAPKLAAAGRDTRTLDPKD